MAVVTLDRRERALSDALQIEHQMTELPVGDVHFRFDGGTEWIGERKTVRDLANSIRESLSLQHVSLSGAAGLRVSWRAVIHLLEC